MVLKILQNSQENTRARVSFLKKLQAIGLVYMCFCEFYEILKNAFFFFRTPPVAASILYILVHSQKSYD